MPVAGSASQRASLAMSMARASWAEWSSRARSSSLRSVMSWLAPMRLTGRPASSVTVMARTVMWRTAPSRRMILWSAVMPPTGLPERLSLRSDATVASSSGWANSRRYVSAGISMPPSRSAVVP